jgi:ketosteroid isomerase-like protein
MSTSTPLRDAVVAAFTHISPTDLSFVEELRPLYSPDIEFEDPVQKVHGYDEFTGVNVRLAKRARELSFTVDRVVGDDAEFFITWHMRLRPKVGPLFELDGVSHLRAEDGKIRHHRDYWDLAALFASAIPGGRRILRTLLKPLA